MSPWRLKLCGGYHGKGDLPPPTMCEIGRWMLSRGPWNWRWGPSARSGSFETLWETANLRPLMTGPHTSPCPDHTRPGPEPPSAGLQRISSPEQGLGGLLAQAVDGHPATFAASSCRSRGLWVSLEH